MATAIPVNHAAFSLQEVADAVNGELRGDPEVRCEGVAIDSRAVREGGLFVAVRGERTDGHAYLAQAVQAGAAALLVRLGAQVPEGIPYLSVADPTLALGQLARHHRERWQGQVVAITGSAGKTTTKELTAGALTGGGRKVLKTPGNLNNQFGVPMTLFLLDANYDTAVLELGTSGAGEIAYLGQLVRPDVAAVLLAAAAHTEGLGSVEAVAREKASLWSTLAPEGTAVVNLDDAGLRRELKALSPGKVLGFGTVDGADVQLMGQTSTTDGSHVRFRMRGGEEQALDLNLFGEPAALDACCALTICMALLDEGALPQVIGGLASVQTTPGRLQLRCAERGYWVLDDSYNANPESTLLGLETLMQIAAHTGGRGFAILGDMRELGELSVKAHTQVGEHAVNLGVSVLVGHGAEMVHATTAAVRLAAGRFGRHPTRVVQLSDRQEVARVAAGLLRPNDVVLVKGSRSMGMEAVVAALLGGKHT